MAELRSIELLAISGGLSAMDYYGGARAVQKPGGSPVTEADHASNQTILEGLARQFPGDAVLSEESADSSARLNHRRVWLVDPLDGTREFIAMNGEFSIMIGLSIDGEAALGVVYLPAHGILYSAIRGRGAWAMVNGQRHRLIAAAPHGPLRLICSRSHPDPLLTRIQDALGIDDVLPCGSVGVKCARIAEGTRDLYVHPVPFLKEWDTCAPEVILREAGGTVSDCRGEPLRYNKSDLRQPHGILACAPGVQERVLEIVRPLYTSGPVVA